MSLKEKVAIVTGGERGIGRAIAEELLSRGMKVCIGGIDTVSAERTIADLNAGDALSFRECDVRDEDAVRQLVAFTVATFGRLDAMIANAGLANPGHNPIQEVTLEAWDRVIRTNLTGPFLSAKHAAPELKKQGGSIVLIASTRALQSMPNGFAYSASKAGLLGLTHAMANSLGPAIRVNAISPGWIHKGDQSRLSPEDHSQHPAGRVGKPADIAAMVAYLISEEAGFITGQNFVVDGGMTKKMIYH